MVDIPIPIRSVVDPQEPTFVRVAWLPKRPG